MRDRENPLALWLRRHPDLKEALYERCLVGSQTLWRYKQGLRVPNGHNQRRIEWATQELTNGADVVWRKQWQHLRRLGRRFHSPIGRAIS